MKVRVDEVIVAEPRGFCAGVEMAITALGWMVRLFEPPVYCYHEIVHNAVVVDCFERAGVIFVDDPNDVPPGAPLMLSAHGSAPDVAQAARSHERIVVDAVCPLVTKVHHEARVRAHKGFEIIYAGHVGHEETIGTLAEAPTAMHLVKSATDIDVLPLRKNAPVALLAQTTLAHGEWSDILARARELHPDLWMPARSDLCFATTNRQAAVTELAGQVDLLLVIGSPNSSNTQALLRTALSAGCSRALLIGGAADVTRDVVSEARIVGVTAGASAPEAVVQAVVAKLAPQRISVLAVTNEDEYFPLPRELRDLVRAAMTVACITLGVPLEVSMPEQRDHRYPAAAVLDSLKPACGNSA